MHNGRMTESPWSELELEHSKLRPDLELVRRYAELHTDDYVETRFENEPIVRVIVLMSGDHRDEHETALRAIVQYPNQLEVRQTPFSRSQLEEIRNAVTEIGRSRPRAFMQWGIGNGRVDIQLSADQEVLAASIHDRFGEAVKLKVGLFAYPPTESEVAEKRNHAAARPRLPLLSSEQFTVSLEGDVEVPSGRSVDGALRIQNHTDRDAVVETNGLVTARIVDPETGDSVGGYFGAQALPLVTYRIPPGGTVSIPLLVGTTSSVRTLGYAVPPGAWAIEVPIKIEGSGQFRTPLLPILVLEPEISPL
jgi:hypothetical protein